MIPATMCMIALADALLLEHANMYFRGYDGPQGLALFLSRYGDPGAISFDGHIAHANWGLQFWRGMLDLAVRYNAVARWPVPLSYASPCYLELPEAGCSKALLKCPKSATNPGSGKGYAAYGWLAYFYQDVKDKR